MISKILYELGKSLEAKKKKKTPTLRQIDSCAGCEEHYSVKWVLDKSSVKVIITGSMLIWVLFQFDWIES